MLEFLCIIGGCIVGYAAALQFLKNKYSANNGAEITDLKKQLELKDHDHALEIEKINAVNNLNTTNIKNLHAETVTNLETNHISQNNDFTKKR